MIGACAMRETRTCSVIGCFGHAGLRPPSLRAPRCARQESSREWKVERASPLPLLASGFRLLAPSPRPRRGFTLVELLVVIGVIAVIVALLLPTLGRATDSARRIQCASNIRNLLQWTECYAAENRGWLPALHSPNVCWPYWFDSNSNGFDWRNRMLSDLGDTRDLFYCPSNPAWNINTYWNFPDGLLTDTVSVWGYSYYPRPVQDVFVWANPPTASSPMKLSNQPWTASQLTDSPYYDVIWSDNCRSDNGQFGSAEGANHVFGNEPTPAVMPNGNGGTNVGYLDGHVEWIAQNSMLRRWYYIDSTDTYRGYW